MRIYLDTCCLNRPFDDQHQDRIHAKTDAIALILDEVQQGKVKLAGSDVLTLEISQDRHIQRKNASEVLLNYADFWMELDSHDDARAGQLNRLGFGPYDSYHIVAAEKGGCDYLLTTDDRLLRKARQHVSQLRIKIMNPLRWIEEILPHEKE
ncbi:MAG: hypothetical protein HZA50_15765 [Planctomycetes bacterium]|nr:hypothetical protein [Planctomycetota bacterium]